MRISDWSSDVCSSDLPGEGINDQPQLIGRQHRLRGHVEIEHALVDKQHRLDERNPRHQARAGHSERLAFIIGIDDAIGLAKPNDDRSEEHTSELQSLMRISYAVFCLKTKNTKYTQPITHKP